MNIEDLNNKLVIVKDEMKNSLLELISKCNKILNIKIITLSELKKKYYFDYDREAIHYMCNKYNVNFDVAKIYLNNMYYLKDINDDKINHLREIKNDLDDNKLLTYNNQFKKYLNNNTVVLLDMEYVDKFYKNIFSELNNTISINLEHSASIKELYKCITMEEEIAFIATKICELIKSGINVNNIKIANVNSSNSSIIKRVFKIFNIPINIESDISIKGSKIVKVFKENYSNDITKTIDIVRELVITKKDNDVFKQLINIVNLYGFTNDYESVKDLLFNDIDNAKTKNIKLKNAVKIIDIRNEIINDDDYVFLINYNEGVIPVNHKNEDYLSDEVKSKIGISTSFELNEIEEKLIKDKIKMTNHLIITYSKYDSGNEIYISSSYDKDLFIEKESNINFNNSNLYNKLRLVSLRDENNKYGTVNDELIVLNNHYKDFKYLDYSNKYITIDKDLLNDYLGNKLSLSYSSLNNYCECGFKYYLSNVLHLDKFEDSFEITIGNIFHHILSKCFTNGFDFDSEWNKEISDCKYDFNNMEKFFIDKLKEELILVIDTIKNQLKYTLLKKTMYEKEIIINVNEDLHITFKGYVDKILYDEFNGQTIVAIVDYKTGNPNTNINNVKYGLDMQLPIYMYLIKNSNIVENVRIGGFYLQKILNSDKNVEDRVEGLKLQGYSNSDESVLSKVDSSYANSHIIKSMKMGNNGFYAYSKVLSDENFDYISSLVNDKIIECSKDILNAKFDINPKVIKDNNKSCKFCKYKDICYMQNDDIVNLKEIKDIFGGEE